MPVVITQTIRPQGMGLNVLVRLLPVYEFHCKYKLVAWEKLTVLTLAGLTLFFFTSYWLRSACFHCAVSTFQTYTVNCFEVTLELNLHVLSSLLRCKERDFYCCTL